MTKLFTTSYEEEGEYAAAKRVLLIVCAFGQTNDNFIFVDGTFDEQRLFDEIKDFDHDKADTSEPIYSNMNNAILVGGSYTIDCSSELGEELVFKTTEYCKTIVLTNEKRWNNTDVNADALCHRISVIQ